MERIDIGKIVNTHGLKGELKIESWSDFDAERYVPGNTVYLSRNGEVSAFTVTGYRPHKGFALVKLEGITDISTAEQYRGCIVSINAADRPDLPEGEYYFDQLIGLQVFDEEGNFIGEVIAVEETNGAQDNLRVERPGQKDALIPNVEEFVKDVDMEEGRITIHVIQGLL